MALGELGAWTLGPSAPCSLEALAASGLHTGPLSMRGPWLPALRSCTLQLLHFHFFDVCFAVKRLSSLM